MVVGNRLVRIIFATFVLIILVLNFIWWVAPQSATALVGHDPTQTSGLYTFKGFSWFFEHLGKCPGIQPMIKEIQNLNFTLQDNTNIGDGILDILRMFILPLNIFWGIISTIWQNLAWLFGFIGAMFY